MASSRPPGLPFATRSVGSDGSSEAARNASPYSRVETTNPSGPRNPARTSSPRFAPLPPAPATSPAPTSASGTTYGSDAITAPDLGSYDTHRSLTVTTVSGASLGPGSGGGRPQGPRGNREGA